MNKNAREKQLLEEAYSQVLGEDWKKGTSKAPKGASFDSKKNYKPSGVDANSDGPAGRYRRTRPPGSGSTQTHGEAGISSDEEIKIGSTVITNDGVVVMIDEIDTDRDGKTIYVGTDKDGQDHALYSDQIHAEAEEEPPRDSMYLKDDPEALKKALEYHRRNVAKLRRKSMLDLTDEEYDSLKHSEGELELNEGEEDNELEALINAEDAEDVDVDENKDEDKHVTDEAKAFKEVEEDTPE
jgi:hypothetical protein